MRLEKRWIVLLVAILHMTMLAGCVAINKRAGSDDEIATANVNLASEYFRKNQLNFAFESLKKALVYNPDSVEGNTLMGLVYERLEQPEKANDHFEHAEGLVTKEQALYSYVHNVYGTFLCNRGQMKEAESHFTLAINNRLNQNPQAVMENAGFCALQQQKFEKAESYFRDVLKLSPTTPGVLFKMAKLKFETENYLSARAYVQRYHENNRDPESFALAIEIERVLNAESEAAKLIAQLKKTFPDSEQARAY